MDEDYLPTEPATQIQFITDRPPRDQPCWRCRLHLRWPPRRDGEWRVHWQCRKPPTLTYLQLRWFRRPGWRPVPVKMVVFVV